MGVHSPQVDALEEAMRTYTTPDTLPFEAGDPAWVAQLFSTVRAGDLDAVVERLDAVARVMRRAAKARRMLATVDPELIRAGLQVRTARRGAS